MHDETAILKIADSHFALHLLGPGEPDASAEDGTVSEIPLPENLAEDLVDEICDMLDDIADDYSDNKGWERALLYGFLDGVLAVSDGSWSELEDSYYEDAANEAFARADAAIDEITADFEGSRPWDETAKGYVRSAVARAEDEPEASGEFPWTASANAFFYGAEAAYDLEWKIIITPANNLLVTDEDSIQEAAAAQLAAESGGSLLDRVFNMMGIDPDELAAAIDKFGPDEDDADEPLEGELEVEEPPSDSASR